MTDDEQEPQHRAYYQPDARDIEFREEVEDDEGVFTVRMPVASTGEVRNQGDEPLSRDELRGMRDQINSGGVGVFLDHGANTDVGSSRYSAVGKLGEWRKADLVTPDREDGEEGSTLLVADARLMDPDTLPRIPSRGALGAIKSQAERNIGLASSIGWREDESFRGGVDLMEVSIVGIPADPRTTSGAEAAEVLARAAETRDVDPEQLVDEFRAVVMGPDSDSDGDDTDEPDQRETPMTDDDSGDEQPDETHDQDDWRDRMIDMQERQLETLNALADALRESDDDDDDEDDDEDDEEEQSANTDDTETQSESESSDGETDETDDSERSFEIDGEEVTADDIRAMRDQLSEAEPETPETDAEREAETDERDADADDGEGDDPLAKYGLGGGW